MEASALPPPPAPPEDVASSLDAVASAVGAMDPVALASSIDYVLAPVTSAMRREADAMRPPPPADPALPPASSASSIAPAPAPAVPARVRASRRRALESALRCVAAATTRAGTCGGSRESALDLLLSVVAVLGLPRESDSARAESSAEDEHVRLAGVAALRSIVRALDDARDVPGLAEDERLPGLGYCVSVLFGLASHEARLGAKGNRDVRTGALRALTELVETVARVEPDSTAFFLPGIVSGFVGAVAAGAGLSRGGGGGGGAWGPLAARTKAAPRSGAAEDSGALEACAQGLGAIVARCLADEHFDAAAPPGSEPGASDADANAELFERLRGELACDRERRRRERNPNGGANEEGKGPDEEASEARASEDAPPTPASPSSLRVARDAAWLRATAPRVESALAPALTSLAAHPKPAVRAAAALAAARVLAACRATLPGEEHRKALYGLLLSASRDPWANVRAIARRALGFEEAGLLVETPDKNSPGDPKEPPIPSVRLDLDVAASALEDALVALPRAVRAGAAAAVDAARRALAAMDAMGAERTTAALLTRQRTRRAAVAGVEACFAFDASGGARPRLAGPKETDANANAGGGNDRIFPNSDADDAAATPRTDSASTNETSPTTAATPTTTTKPKPKPKPKPNLRLPRRPPGLAYLSDPEVYAEVALVARRLGAYPGALHALVADRVAALRDAASDAHLTPDETFESADRSGHRSGGRAHHHWVRGACACAAAINETLRGAADAAEEAEARLEAVRLEAARDADALASTSTAARSARDAASRAARLVLDEYLAAPLWTIASAADARPGENEDEFEHERARGKPTTPPAFVDRRGDAALASLLVEGAGVCAACAGPARPGAGFAVVPATLCPLLEKLGDADAGVRDCARAALEALGEADANRTTGDDRPPEDGEDGDHRSERRSQTSFRETTGKNTAPVDPVGRLLEANFDYVADALARRLRRLDRHPTAPAFFEACLSAMGAESAGASLVHLRESVATARRATEVRARGRVSARIRAPLLRVFRLVAEAAEGDAGRCESREVSVAVDKTKPIRDALAEAEEISSRGRDDDSRRRRRGVTPDDSPEEEEEGEERPLASLHPSTRARAEAAAEAAPRLISGYARRLARRAALAAITGDVLDAAAPAMEASDASLRAFAADAVAAALLASAAIDRCAAADEPVRETLASTFPDAVPEAMKSEDHPGKKPARTLPRVHAAWPHVVVSLGGVLNGGGGGTMPPALPVSAVRPEAYAASLRAARSCAKASGGDFIAARFARDAWPAIERIVRAGVPHARGGATGAKTLEERMQEAAVVSVGSGKGVVKDEGDDRAEKASARVRVAAFEFLAAVAADEGAKGALRDVAASAAETALKWALGGGGGAGLFSGEDASERVSRGGPAAANGWASSAASDSKTRAAARGAAVALARIDPDAVWTTLAIEATAGAKAATPGAPRWADEEGRGVPGSGDEDENRPPSLPAFAAIRPSTRGEGDGAGAARRAELAKRLLRECFPRGH